jgi:hypothetical protein
MNQNTPGFAAIAVDATAPYATSTAGTTAPYATVPYVIAPYATARAAGTAGATPGRTARAARDTARQETPRVRRIRAGEAVNGARAARLATALARTKSAAVGRAACAAAPPAPRDVIGHLFGSPAAFAPEAEQALTGARTTPAAHPYHA